MSEAVNLQTPNLGGDPLPPAVVEKGSKIPDALTRELIRRGLRNVDIVEYLESIGIQVTSAAVSSWKKKNGYEVRAPTPERLALLPWKIATKHGGNRIYGILLLEARDRADDPLSRKQRSELDHFKRMLGDSGGVIHYDQVNGFVVVEPREGIDEDMIREPGIDNHGRPIAGWEPRTTV